jgi:SAM-dependent methyltransferase
MNTSAFDDLTDVYESLIDWPKRLAHEGPFYRALFAEHGVRWVVDVACGTGHHAAMFHGWGLEVEGADIAPRMIDRARAAFGEPPGLRFVVRGFSEPVPQPDQQSGQQPGLDAAVCVGNSLALAPDQATAAEAIRQMLASVRVGGVVVVHVLNLAALPDGPCVWQKCRRMTPPDLGETLVLKGVHRCGAGGFVDLVLCNPTSAAILHTESVPLLGLDAETLTTAARQSGAVSTAVFGGYDHQPFDPARSTDLILVAMR